MPISPEIDVALSKYQDDILGRIRSLEEADKAAVEDAIESRYKLIGLSRPLYIWLQSPWQLTHAQPYISDFLIGSGPFVLSGFYGTRLGEIIRRICCTVGDETFQDFMSKVLPSDETFGGAGVGVGLSNAVSRQLQIRINNKPERQYTRELLSNLRSTLVQQDDNDRYFGRLRMFSNTDFLLPYMRREWGSRPAFRLEWGSWHVHRGLGVVDFARKFFNLNLPADDDSYIDCLLTLASVHASLSFKGVCLVSQGPISMCFDNEHRPHFEDGPCLKYRDGFSVYAWHGNVTTSEGVANPVTFEKIEEEFNVEVRRVLTTRYGEARYLSDAGAQVIDESHYGTLFRKRIPSDEPMVMVRVINRSPEPDGSFRPYFLRVPPSVTTAKAAVAWTFGMGENEYVPLQET